jgi:hypothetical protein
VDITVLVVPDCPHRALIHERLDRALASAGVVGPHLHEHEVRSADEAAHLGMHGSPTVLIDGQDPFQTGNDQPSLSCRLYRNDEGISGAPSIAQLVEALMR